MKIDIKIVRLDGRTQTRHLRTPGRMQLNGAGVNAVLMQEADRVERYFPGIEFRLVPLRGGNFNFIEIAPEIACAGQTA